MWLSLAASYLFYGWWDWRFLVLLTFTITLDFTLGLRLHRTHDPQWRKRYLWASIATNLAVLGFFKYFNFFIDSTAAVIRAAGFEPAIHTLHIVLPVGISFYTFQSMSYTIDIYRREIEPETNYFRYATFVSLFPQLVAGPIVRARSFLPQFRSEKRFDWNRFTEGLGWCLWGFYKKVALADSLAPFVDQCFAAPETFSSSHLLVGVLLYSFQIYGDFSGYSSIAIGLAHIMGYQFPTNFNSPYFSKSFSEFWTRWHISLSSWLRDYLYIPLGGNRKGTFKTYRNLMLTMLLGGLWHGANWTFLVWGLLHGLYLVAQRLLSSSIERVEKVLCMPRWIQRGLALVTVYALTCFAWIFFRAPDLTIAFSIIRRIATLEQFNWTSVQNKFHVMQAAVMIIILLLAELINIRRNLTILIVQRPVFRVVAMALVLWLIAFFGTFDADSFIYFQF
ncbi:MBOAT family protein [Rhabdobacter roseus]|uniref:D-alanyl-lipoteichoic acid acyltransferase DltB (MBOAT superfamily) n=1 Tax=Rhabdobacter roseus TaxID=1655419 RepID=A0A840TQ24_9BACT|nr:MBOAT family O-acyltransferase [Rhabdobacter roseus]MBB5285005.1 D-alanyl-lipoteichoic acid acyltransferase DltB (MBOAT superfamily) [Rhabdobacter roseus]